MAGCQLYRKQKPDKKVHIVVRSGAVRAMGSALAEQLAKYVIISDLACYQGELVSCLKETESTQSLPATSELRCQLQ